jgi:hypothetical protein
MEGGRIFLRASLFNDDLSNGLITAGSISLDSAFKDWDPVKPDCCISGRTIWGPQLLYTPLSVMQSHFIILFLFGNPIFSNDKN